VIESIQGLLVHVYSAKGRSIRHYKTAARISVRPQGAKYAPKTSRSRSHHKRCYFLQVLLAASSRALSVIPRAQSSKSDTCVHRPPVQMRFRKTQADAGGRQGVPWQDNAPTNMPRQASEHFGTSPPSDLTIAWVLVAHSARLTSLNM
jgi:hypothetical protein